MQFIIENLILILVLAGCSVIGITALFLFTGLGSRVKDWVSPASDKYINCKYIDEDMNIRDRRLVIEKYCIVDEKRKLGFHLVHNLLISKPHSTKQMLCLNMRDSFPIDFLGKLTAEERDKYPSAADIYVDSTNDSDSETSKDTAHNMMGMSLSIIALAGAVVFLIMAIFVFWGGAING